MHVEIKTMPELRVASVAHVGPYDRICEAFERLGEVAAQNGLLNSASAMLAIYRDDPKQVPQAELHSDAGLLISDAARVPQGLGEQRIAAGRYACTTHVGPYEQLGDVWARFRGEWLTDSGEHMRDGMSYEIYRNTPANAPKEQLRTELYIALT